MNDCPCAGRATHYPWCPTQTDEAADFTVASPNMGEWEQAAVALGRAILAERGGQTADVECLELDVPRQDARVRVSIDGGPFVWCRVSYRGPHIAEYQRID